MTVVALHHDTDLLAGAVTVNAYIPTVGRNADPDHDFDVDPDTLRGYGHVDLGWLTRGTVALVVDLRAHANVRVVVALADGHSLTDLHEAISRLTASPGQVQREFDANDPEWNNNVIRIGRLAGGLPAYLRAETAETSATVWLEPQGLEALHLQTDHLRRLS